MIDLPEELTDDRLVDRLDTTLRAHQTTRGMRVSMGWTCACGYWSKTGHPEAITAHQAEQLTTETKRIVVDTLLHLVEQLRESDGCQDYPFDLALGIDGEHANAQLTARYRAERKQQVTIQAREWAHCPGPECATRVPLIDGGMLHRFIPNIGWQHLARTEDVKQARVIGALRVLTGEAP